VATVWVLGDQLNTGIGAMRTADRDRDSVLLVESHAKNTSRGWHRQRLHFYVSSMRHFAADLRAEGWRVDYREAESMSAGLREHVAEHSPDRVIMTEPNSLTAKNVLSGLGVEFVENDQFLTSVGDFASWAATRKQLRMEDFYRRQRLRLGYLMEGDEPVGGQWNYDHENRQPPPKKGPWPWPAPPTSTLDEIDRAVLESLPDSCAGAEPTGTWATSREGALERLAHFVDELLPMFGPHEDAMLSHNWHLAHSMLSPYLNNGLLLPREVCNAVQSAFDAGRVPIASAEGFIRQVIGWREYIRGLYWLWMPGYESENSLDATRPLPPVFRDPSLTHMSCVASSIGAVHERGWAHHIERLMIMGNLALISGINPKELTDWMWESFVDGAEWVMVPNVVGMALYADGGKMSTKPYAAGGAYIDRMSDHCKGCHYDRKKRVGDDACPFTTLYWDFLLRHEERFLRNPRMGTQVRAAQKLADRDAVQHRAAEVLQLLDSGRL
jgi:deoxyribodipyrimidine photolyase-related protein